MRVTRKSLLILSGILIGCVVVTLLLSFAGRGGKTQAQATTYFFAKYDSPDALMAASIENSSGSVTIATKDGTCYIDGDDGRNPNSQAITEFFAAVYRLPLEELVEGASSADDQYGLNTPQATVMLEDVKQEGLMFKIGAQTPDGDGRYACLSGDNRVFIMADSYAGLFLQDVRQFYVLQ